MATYLGNAFSLQMVSAFPADVHIEAVEASEVPVDAESVIGHPDTAAVVSSILEREVTPNRVSISLEAGDELYVAQLFGGRLPEGATTLPEGFSLGFLRVTLK